MNERFLRVSEHDGTHCTFPFRVSASAQVYGLSGWSALYILDFEALKSHCTKNAPVGLVTCGGFLFSGGWSGHLSHCTMSFEND